MRIGVTGAQGLIGGSLIKRLAMLADTEVTALGRSRSAAAESLRWQVGDLGSPEDCAHFVAGQDVIIHLAHTNSPLTSDRDMVGDVRDNLMPTLNLLQAICAEGRCPHFIYPSSGGAIYGLASGAVPFSEEASCFPTNSYGVLKLTIEHYLRLASQRNLLNATVLRISNAYGWRLPPERSQGLIGTAVSRAIQGQPVRLFGNPANVRDYIHYEDICAVVTRVLGRRAGFEVFNVGTGAGHSVADVIDLIEQVWGRPLERTYETQANAGYLPNWCVLDVRKAGRELGWEPRIGLVEGIRYMFAEDLGAWPANEKS